jgi:hypothetical protein
VSAFEKLEDFFLNLSGEGIIFEWKALIEFSNSSNILISIALGLSVAGAFIVSVYL